MIILYQGPIPKGAGNPLLITEGDELDAYKHNLMGLLAVRDQPLATDLISEFPWQLNKSDMWVGDYFLLLRAITNLELYEKARAYSSSPTHVSAFGVIASTLAELGVSVRYIGVGLDPTPPLKKVDRRALSKIEIDRLVNKYIGVGGGYLGDFSYATHKEFYVQLDLPIDPNKIPGTTRERFIKILTDSPPNTQAVILQGIIERFPPESHPIRTQAMRSEIQSWLERLGGIQTVTGPDLRTTSALVERALSDAESLVRTSGATSGVDRVHTALHGYLRQVVLDGNLTNPPEASLTQLYKIIRLEHPAFLKVGPRAEDIAKVNSGLATIVDALNPLRNKASVAHANEDLLAHPEAMLVINSVRTILHYLDSKIEPRA